MYRAAETQVSAKSDMQAGKVPHFPPNGQKVGQRLGGMIVSAVPGVNHRDPRFGAGNQRCALFGVTHGDNIGITSHNPDGIRHALPFGRGRTLRLGKAQNLSAQLVHGRLK